MKTRTTKNSNTKQPAQPDESSDTSNTLAPTTSNPPLLFVLPDNASPDARIVTLPNPATSLPCRYLFCPESGIHEFTKIDAPRKSPRSWLLAPPRTQHDINDDVTVAENDQSSSSPTEKNESLDVSTGYVIQDADFFLATPLDPLFVLLPALLPKPEETKQLFLSIEDYLDALAEHSTHLKHLVRSDKLRHDFEKRANAVCDNVAAGDDKMYRLSNDKLLAELLKKAKKMSANALPPSMENHFIQEALKVPVMIVQREESFTASVPEDPPVDTQSTPSLETQDSNISVLTEATSVTTTTMDPPASSSPAPQQVIDLLRLRTAFNFILSSYIPTTLRKTLLTSLTSPAVSSIDFQPLDAHLEHVANLKKEQHALRSISDNISRKRGLNDEEAEDLRAEKKRKKDEEDAKKKNTSRGVKQLGKVNTTGMKKMTSFFTKAPLKKA